MVQISLRVKRDRYTTARLQELKGDKIAAIFACVGKQITSDGQSSYTQQRAWF